MMRTPTTRGHLDNNAGIRGHSAGEYFPYVVYAEGAFENLKWRVRCPDGSIRGSFTRPHRAAELAKALKEGFI